MIDLDPLVRPTFDTLLHTSRSSVFPESFYSFLHNYVSSFNDLPHNTPFQMASPPTATSIATQSSIAPSTSGSTLRPSSSLGQNSNAAPTAEAPAEPLPSDSDHRLGKLWADYESVEPYLVSDAGEETVMDVKVEYTTTTASKPFQVSIHDLVLYGTHYFFCRTFYLSNCASPIATPNCSPRRMGGLVLLRKVCILYISIPQMVNQ
jgi:phosphoinositide-3-kinase regulatory subunit 4